MYSRLRPAIISCKGALSGAFAKGSHSCIRRAVLKIMSVGCLITLPSKVSLLRVSQRAQKNARKSVQMDLRGCPEKLETIANVCTKEAGHQLHPSMVRMALQGNLAKEQLKKM